VLLAAPQKIRTVELDGKVIKLQIVGVGTRHAGSCRTWFCILLSPLGCPTPAVGHRWPGALQDHHQQLLPWGARHHCKTYLACIFWSQLLLRQLNPLSLPGARRLCMT
jgi:hypothetical protein